MPGFDDHPMGQAHAGPDQNTEKVQKVVQALKDFQGDPTDLNNVMTNFVFSIGVLLLLAHLYKKHKVGAIFEQTNQTNPLDFQYGLFDTSECCGRDKRLCCIAACCGGVRWADTLSKGKVQIMSFWVAVVFWACTENMGGLASLAGPFAGVEAVQFLSSVAAIVALIVCVSARQKIRRMFGLQTGGCTLINDCFAWLCCSCCAVVQEARQMDYVRGQEPLLNV